MDPLTGSQAQPPATHSLLVTQTPSKYAATSTPSSPSTEMPRISSSQSGYSLKRSFACTNLLLLSLASPDGSVGSDASLVPRVRMSCSKEKSKPNTSTEK